jgi:hypothetical protein
MSNPPSQEKAPKTYTDVIYDIVASGLGAVPTLVLADPAGYDVNFSRARAQIVQNTAFIKAEMDLFA